MIHRIAVNAKYFEMTTAAFLLRSVILKSAVVILLMAAIIFMNADSTSIQFSAFG